jgi:hypothetical protein
LDELSLKEPMSGGASRASRPIQLDANIAPVPTLASEHVQLRAIKNLIRVNAIAEAHKLPIGGSGLTVIYGDNGAGKSGYSL